MLRVACPAAKSILSASVLISAIGVLLKLSNLLATAEVMVIQHLSVKGVITNLEVAPRY